jgi:hypothetical protein
MNNAKQRNFMIIEENELSIKQDQSRPVPSCLAKGAAGQMMRNDFKKLPEVKYSTPVQNIPQASENLQLGKLIPEERNFRQMDELFLKLGSKMKSNYTEAYSNEKLNFSRAINFIFKNNLYKEVQINEIKLKRELSNSKFINGEKKRNIFKNYNSRNNDNNQPNKNITNANTNIISSCIQDNKKLNSNTFNGNVKTFNVSDFFKNSQEKRNNLLISRTNW